MQVASSIKRSTVSADGLNAIERILSYENNAVVGRYAEDHSVSEEVARIAFSAFKQFMVVNVFVEGIKTPSQAIDDFWHIFVLYMRDYEEFCKSHLRGIVYHDPGKDDSGMAFYPMTRATAKELCGELDPRFWPEDHAPHPRARCVSCSVSEPRFS